MWLTEGCGRNAPPWVCVLEQLNDAKIVSPEDSDIRDQMEALEENFVLRKEKECVRVLYVYMSAFAQ